MSTLKQKIENWLLRTTKTFENSKDALNAFEKETKSVSSVIYFSRIFSVHTARIRETKKTKVASFIKNHKHATCELAHAAYVGAGQAVSIIYFSRVYTQVRKEKIITTIKKQTIKSNSKKASLISFTSYPLKQK